MEGPEYLTHICPSPYLFLRNHYEVSLLPSQKRDLCLGLYVGNKRDFWKLCVESTAIPSWMGPVSSENCVLHISMVCCVTPLLIMRKMWAVWQDYHLSVAGHRVFHKYLALLSTWTQQDTLRVSRIQALPWGRRCHLNVPKCMPGCWHLLPCLL